VGKNEIVGNPVCQHEIPREIASIKVLTAKPWGHGPGDQGLVEIASLDITII
jgi:hypothetical protein